MTSTPDLPPGYTVDPDTGAWLTLPWPDDLATLPPSLGPQVIRWCESHLVHHLTGGPWQFTRGQRRFLALWYAVTPQGRWLYRSGVKRGAKGTGKDPLAAAIACAELAGPVRFAGWDGDRPVGEPHLLPLVQIAGNSEAQGKDLLRVLNALLPQRTRDELGIDCGETRTILKGGGRVELLTASQKTAEGDPATAILLNESHHMTESNGGHAIAEVARRNVGKSPSYLQSRLLELTNAHEQGADSVAERSYEAWQSQVAGRTRRVDILYDSREAPPDVILHDDADLMRGLRAAYSDSPWSDLERLRDEAQDPRTSPADSIRYYLNGLAAAESAWVDPQRFDSLADASVVVADRDQLAMFLDCSKSNDATALVACRVSDGHVMTLGAWQRPHGHRGQDWLAPRHEVDAAVRAAFDRYRVGWFGVDPSPARDDATEASYWLELADAWHRDYRDRLTLWATPGAQGHSTLFDMRTSQPGGSQRNERFTAAAMLTAQEVDESGSFTHDGHPMLRQHVHNARRRPNKWGVTLSKVSRDSSRHVDLAVAMVGARMGRRLLLNGAPQRGGLTRSRGHVAAR